MFGLSNFELLCVLAFILSTGTAGAWWMSAMYSRLKTTGDDVGLIKSDIHEMKTSQHGENVEIWKQMNANGRNIVELDTRLTGVEDRIECLEEK